jgi:hypothetical protein
MLVSGGDQTYQVAKLQSGNDLIIDSGGRIEKGTDLFYEVRGVLACSVF